ncbi:MAG: hypothetical protein IJH07_05850 [Ruminococcus sp.]|nr:hypothetical protein [Ruminococcus sp.]
MNKKRVNEWILPAREAIIRCKITEDGKSVIKTFRGQISSFGAAVVMGSLKSAVAFFTEQGGASVSREKLIVAMYYIINGKAYEIPEKTDEQIKAKEVFEWVCKSKDPDMKEKFIDASIALKLALNFFDLKEEKTKKNDKKEETQNAGKGEA